MCEELLAEMVTEKFAGLKENRDLYKIWVDAKHRACFGMTLEESKSGSLQDISGKKIHRYVTILLQFMEQDGMCQSKICILNYN